MELFVIMFLVPVVFIASTIYMLLLERVVAPCQRISTLFVCVSGIVLASSLVELFLLAFLGAMECDRLEMFRYAKLLILLLGVPALANVLVLERVMSRFRWYEISMTCTAYGFFLVLMQCLTIKK